VGTVPEPQRGVRRVCNGVPDSRAWKNSAITDAEPLGVQLRVATFARPDQSRHYTNETNERAVPSVAAAAWMREPSVRDCETQAL